MKRDRILEDAAAGYSHRFAECMQLCLRSLMEKFGATIGYTQSDEMMVRVG